MIRILIADDHTVVRKGLKQILLEEFPDAEITGVSEAASLLSNALASEWDVIITDLAMPGRSGLDTLKELKTSRPKLPILVLSMYPEDQYAVRVLKAGAAGYLNKETAPDDLVRAVRQVMLGKKFITPAVAELLATSVYKENNKQLHENLSDREFDVFKLIASGKTVSSIAELLSLGVTTVSTYRARILDKMQMKNNSALAIYAIENKLI